MSVHTKKLPTDGSIEVVIGSRRPRLFVVPKETAQRLAKVLNIVYGCFCRPALYNPFC